MADVSKLIARIDAEFDALNERMERARTEHLHDYHERQERLATFERLLAELPTTWRPRLEALTERFGDRLKVTPRVTSASREATFDVESKLARIRLRLSASTDRDVRKLVLDYHLEILPILMQFDSHQQAEWPFEAIDKEAVARWVDDRIVDFVKTYLSLHENEWYLKDHMVEDPIAGVRFPKFAAAAKLTHQGQDYYFVDDETRQEFARQKGIAVQ